jgi:phenylpropionate dioxygenase-like ring-hydroxylating dioxygenase large terminal subunit
MINAIDAHHFNTVHHLPVDLEFDVEAKNENNITFSNRTRMPRGNLFTRFAARFYAGPLTYAMSYWFGSTGSVTVGPDFLHFYIIFALRMVDGGKTEGRTILVTRRRRGLFGLGRVVNGVLLFLSWVVGAYFARGDTRVFQTIRFDFKTPIKADASIIQFVKHVEGQRALEWGSWQQEDAGIVRLASVGLGARP